MDARLGHGPFEMRSDRVHGYPLGGGDVRRPLTPGEALYGTPFGVSERTGVPQSRTACLMIQNRRLAGHVWSDTADRALAQEAYETAFKRAPHPPRGVLGEFSTAQARQGYDRSRGCRWLGSFLYTGDF